MRIDITDSCRSRVLCSSCASAWWMRSWTLGSRAPPSWPSMAWVMTSSPTRLIRLSIFSTLTRIELDSLSPAAGLLAADGGAGAGFGGSGVATAAAGLPGASSKKPKSSSAVDSGLPGASSKKPKPSSWWAAGASCSSSRRRATVSATGTLGSGRCWRWASSRRISTSRACRNRSTISARRAIWPLRMRSSRVSSSWVTAVRSSKPNMPAEPLMEWAARKMPLSSSGSGRCRSRPSSSSSRLARCSSVSSKNTWRNWLIPSLMESALCRGQGRTLRVTSSSFGGSKGLTSQPVAPADLPCCFMASLDSVVSIRIGVAR
ncbi:hypothetical protein D9M71_255730 [compost metagenome]